MKICVITPRWAIAGVPLAQRRFAMALAKAGHDVDLVIGRKDVDLTIPPSPGVDVIVWNTKSVRNMIRPIFRYLKSCKPDVVFSAEDHLNGVVLVAAILSRSKAKISCSSRVAPSNSYSNVAFTRRWWAKQLTRAVAWRANALTCVSQDMVESYRAYFPERKRSRAYNVVVDDQSIVRKNASVDHEWFVKRTIPIVAAAGMLEPWKGFADLIEAVSLLHQSGRPVRLAIFGEGALRSDLEELVTKLSLGNYVWMPGRVDNPLAYFARSDVLALSSLAEGMPNVLVEGMLCGCTPVATDCPTGPRELLQNASYGQLVPVNDPQGLANGIAAALDDPTSPADLARAVAPFTESAVISRHFELLGLES